ncbi:hypothetical protein Trydic_g11536, partial [Trypoxylus dichotomus]
ANGQVEQLNRTLIPAIATMTKDPEGRDWDVVLGQVQFSLNNTVHKTTQTTPFRLLFNCQPRAYGDQLQDEAEGEERGTRKNNVNVTTREDVENDTLVEGDLVLMKHEPTGTGTSRKLAEKYKGPYIVIELLPGDRYRIADVPETQRSQRFYEGVAARDVLKRCQPISDAQESDDSSMESDDDGNHVSERVSRCGKAEYCARSDSANDRIGKDGRMLAI